MNGYSSASISFHGCSSFALAGYTPDNANALTFEIGHPGGPEFQITIFGLPPDEAQKIAEMFGVEARPISRNAA